MGNSLVLKEFDKLESTADLAEWAEHSDECHNEHLDNTCDVSVVEQEQEDYELRADIINECFPQHSSGLKLKLEDEVQDHDTGYHDRGDTAEWNKPNQPSELRSHERKFLGLDRW